MKSKKLNRKTKSRSLLKFWAIIVIIEEFLKSRYDSIDRLFVDDQGYREKGCSK